MSTDSIALGLNEYIVITLKKSSYSVSIAANTAEATATLSHNLGLLPFWEYTISLDGGVTYYAPRQVSNIDTRIFIQCYATVTDFVINYTYSSAADPPSNAAFDLVVDYRLFVTEASR